MTHSGLTLVNYPLHTIDNYNGWYTIDANSGDKISYGDGELKRSPNTKSSVKTTTFGLKGPDVPFTWQKNCEMHLKETTTFNQLKPQMQAYVKVTLHHIRVTFWWTCFGVAQYAGWADSR